MTYFVYLDISDPWIAWMVYRGSIVSASMLASNAISSWLARHLQNVARGDQTKYFQKEIKMEKVRELEFPHSISRLTGLYMFENREMAIATNEKWQAFNPDFLQEIEMENDHRASKYDSQWLNESFDIDKASIRAYYSGKAFNENPMWESLVEGRGIVCGTDLRNKAYEVIKQTWPDSLAALEVSRIASHVGLDIGVTYPFLAQEGEMARVDWYIYFPELDDESMKKMQTYKGPVNTNDWKGEKTFTMPNLSHESVIFRI